MAATVKVLGQVPPGPNLGQCDFQGPQLVGLAVQVTMDSSYAAAGEAVDFSGYFGGNHPDAVIFGANGGYVPEWDYTNRKLLARWVDTTVDGAPMTDVTAATDLAAIVFTGVIYGRKES